MLQSLYSLAATGSFCWFLASSLWIYPHSLSYFNESVGGPLNGPNHLLGSCVDWGQDLRYLNWWMNGDWVDGNRNQVFLAYFGYFDPAAVGFAYVRPWSKYFGDEEQPKRDLMETSLHNLKSPSTEGVFTISINLLRGSVSLVRDGIRSVPHVIIGEQSSQIIQKHFSKMPCQNIGYSLKAFAFETGYQVSE